MLNNTILTVVALAATTSLVVVPVTSAHAGTTVVPRSGETDPSDDPSESEMYIDPDAVNARWIDLAFPTSANAEACTSRDIFLLGDTYLWHSWSKFPVGSITEGSRTLYLAAGWYRWKDCVGANVPGGNVYYHDAYLRRRATGDYAHLGRNTLWTDVHGTRRARFGSALNRL